MVLPEPEFARASIATPDELSDRKMPARVEPEVAVVCAEIAVPLELLAIARTP
jgi:hypothetical protein